MNYVLIYEGVQHSDRANNVPLNPLLTLRLPSAAGVRVLMYSAHCAQCTTLHKSKLDKVKFAVFYLCTSVQLDIVQTVQVDVDRCLDARIR